MNITLALDLSSPSGLVTESAILSRGDNVHWDIAVPLPTPLRGVLRRMPLDTKGFKGMDRWTLVIPREGADLSSLIGIRYLRINGFPLHARTTAALANGYQCWSESPIVNRDTILYGERFPTRRPYGDADFYDYPELPGMFHSWSFSYSMIDGSTSNPFFAGLREDLFHTAFEFDLNAATVGIAMDVEGCSWNAGTFARLQLDGEQCLILGEWIVPNPIAQDFLPLSVATARWMELVRECEHVTRALVSKENRSTRMAPVRGYTSWYYYYNRISLSLLERMIDTIADKTDATIFQMDDGYQHRVGDWLIPSPRFARGVKRVATKASSRGLVR
jgi:alpha-galactosidase